MDERSASLRGKELFALPCLFYKSCATWTDLPEEDKPEVAFIGRSNVGKSSLINALVNKKDLARTSNTPGRTQLINFFDLGKKLYLVDLPGYGFAEAPKAVVANWQALIKLYLKGRPQLRRVYVLIDSRHGIKSVDEEFFKLLDGAAVSYQLVLTKQDKIKEAAAEKMKETTVALASSFLAAHPDVLLTSAEKKKGLETLRDEIAAFVPTALYS